jgi:hypothetical protein
VKYFGNLIAKQELFKSNLMFEQLRIVFYNDLGYSKCSYCYYERMSLPCAHILQVADNLDIGMCDVCWGNDFCYHYGRKAEITKALDNSIQNKLPGVPLKYIPKNDGVMFPIYFIGTTEEHYKEMKLLFDNFACAFLKGSSMPLPKERNGDAYDDKSIMGLQPSTGFSQAFEETVSIDCSINTKKEILGQLIQKWFHFSQAWIRRENQ